MLHDDTFGNPAVLEVPAHEVIHERRDDGDRIEALIRYPGFDRSVDPPRPVEIPFRYRMELPFAVSLGTSDPPNPSVLFCATCPIDAETCRVFWFQVQPETAAPPDDVLQRYETMIFEADRVVVETQDPPLAPLDLGAEVHLPFDKLAVAYRRALVRMGFPPDA